MHRRTLLQPLAVAQSFLAVLFFSIGVAHPTDRVST